ncbi:MAG: radical SAM protein [Candidatus Omnitrophica bacterium]|nr:radical SAM protein [Candidatus Omnitrophota bacterium]
MNKPKTDNPLDRVKEITFELTNRCNLKCRICNIWKEKQRRDIALEDIKKVLKTFKNPLSISLTGGEPLLHPDFDKIYKYLYKLFLQKKIKNIDISTNAYSKDIIHFLSKNKKYLQPLTLSVSLDGLEKTHNIQRGKPDAFSKTLKNIIKIKRYNIFPTIKFVITDLNYKEIFKIDKLSSNLSLTFNPKLVEKINNYYHRYTNKNFLTLSPKNFSFIQKSIGEILKNRKNNKNKMEIFSLNCIKRFLLSKNLNFIKKCLTPQNFLFVTSNNNIYSCIYQKKIGTIKEWPKINGSTYAKIKKEAQKGKCPKCLSYHGYLRESNYNKYGNINK